MSKKKQAEIIDVKETSFVNSSIEDREKFVHFYNLSLNKRESDISIKEQEVKSLISNADALKIELDVKQTVIASKIADLERKEASYKVEAEKLNRLLAIIHQEKEEAKILTEEAKNIAEESKLKEKEIKEQEIQIEQLKKELNEKESILNAKDLEINKNQEKINQMNSELSLQKRELEATQKKVQRLINLEKLEKQVLDA